jgi:glycosyltransferase involved in cell wall biosynthesis
MSSAVCKVSIVCPAYEEEEVLPRFHGELCAVLAGLGPEYEGEILYVDDGSRDGTLDYLRTLAAADSRVRYLSFSRNFGQQAALTAGLEHAAGDVVITLDSDLQHPPGLIPVLLARWREGHDIVLTLRQDDARLGWFKRATSRAFNKVMRWLSETEVRAAASDYRLLSRKAVDCLLQLHETHRFLRGMVNWLGFRTATVSFFPGLRGAGVTKYNLRRMTDLAVDAMLSFSKLPLRLSLGAGLAILFFVIAYGVLVLGRALFTAGPTDWPYHLLLLVVLLIGGATLSALGVVGEYVGRVYEQVKGRPLYLLKEISAEPAPAGGQMVNGSAETYPDRDVSSGNRQKQTTPPARIFHAS